MARTSPDLAEFKALSGKSTKRHCPVADVLDVLKQDRGTLEAALAAGDEITNAGIARWLERRKHDVPWQAIRNHRQLVCVCKHEQT